jgi:probable rRNA maturation factor
LSPIMEINVLIDEGFEGCPEASWLQSIVEHVLAAQRTGSGMELSLVIASQERVQQLNRSYRGKDEPTDVLAFSMLPGKETSEVESPPFVAPPDGVLHLGEVIISYPQALIQAEEHHHSLKREVAILIIHGVLHLLGYEHDKPELERQMRAREAEVLNSIERDIA